MPLFRNELPEIGKPFVAICESGIDDIEIYVRISDKIFKDSFGSEYHKSSNIVYDFDKEFMKKTYSEWVYCQTRPYFEQKEQEAEDNQDKSHDYDELTWGADRANES